MTERVQALHVSDKLGNALVSVFVFADDSFQVVDERKGARAVIMDTREKAPAAPVKTLEAFNHV